MTLPWYKNVLGLRGPQSKRRGRYELPDEARLSEIRKHPVGPEGKEAPDLKARAGEAPPGPIAGLRVEVRTAAGMERLPFLLRVLEEEGARATFYMGFGPCRAHLAARAFLAEPSLAWRAWRSGLVGAYGWRTAGSGLFSAPPLALSARINAVAVRDAGHEPGAMPWDHFLWQARVADMDPERIALELARGEEAFIQVFGAPPHTIGAPGWMCSDESLRLQDRLHLLFGSDCRGTDPFLPVIQARVLQTPQVPVTLPTARELLLSEGMAPASAFARLADEAASSTWPVYGASAELEGGPYLEDFRGFLSRLRASGRTVVALRQVLAGRLADGSPLPRCTMAYGCMEGRPGVVSLQLLEV
ncbi:MAG: hypothetical protein ACOYXN_05865 [Acidobacteriota bacterium]